MKNKLKLSLVALSVAAVLVGCATHSDSLGLTEQEGVKTYAEAYAPARDMLMNGQFDEIRSKMLENGKKTVKSEQKNEAGEETAVRDESLTDDEEMERLISGEYNRNLCHRNGCLHGKGDDATHSEEWAISESCFPACQCVSIKTSS